MSALEASLKRQVINWLKTQKLWFYKASDRYTAGIPDIIICKDGRFVAIELKADRGVVSKIQMYMIDSIKINGGVSVVCRTLDEVKLATR